MRGSRNKRQREKLPTPVPPVLINVYIPHNHRDPIENIRPQPQGEVLMDGAGQVVHPPGVYVFDPNDVFDPNWPPHMTLNDRLNYQSRNKAISDEVNERFTDYVSTPPQRIAPDASAQSEVDLAFEALQRMVEAADARNADS